MSTNVRFLENDYKVSNKVRSEIDLRNLDDTPTTSQITKNPTPTIPVSNT